MDNGIIFFLTSLLIMCYAGIMYCAITLKQILSEIKKGNKQ
jgi:hypothetical protein